MPGKNDKINIEQLDYIKQLIEKLKPRVVILENASGLANIGRNRPFLNKVLNDVFSANQGYNLRYKVVNIADYGLPQERKRLIIIAAKYDPYRFKALHELTASQERSPASAFSQTHPWSCWQRVAAIQQDR